MNGTKAGFLYYGLKEVIYGKRLFMEYIMQSEAIREHIVKQIIEKHLEEELHSYVEHIGDQCLIRLRLCDEDLELVFDRLFLNRTRHIFKKNDDTITEYIATSMQYNGEQFEIDLTYFIVYALIHNQQCVEYMQSVWNEDECCQLLEYQEYRSSMFEGLFPTEQIWRVRTLLGFLEKLRKETEYGNSYRQLMDIIYAGYKSDRNRFKKRKVITGGNLRDFYGADCERGEHPVTILAHMSIQLLIMDDLGVRFWIDFDILPVLPLWKSYGNELCSGFLREEETEEEKDQNKNVLNRFMEKYQTVSNIPKITMTENAGNMESTLASVMSMYQLNFRILENFELTEEEVQQLIKQNDSWTIKSYWTMLLTAQLCKCLKQSREAYLNHSMENQNIKSWKTREEKEVLTKLNREYMQKLNYLQEKMTGSDTVIMQLEREVNRLREKEAAQNLLFQKQKQELTALRSYVHGIGECEESKREEQKPEQEKILRWQQEKVLVVGGHVNWQNKLKLMFPSWQFLASDKNNISREVIQGKKYIIFHTEILTHASYYKILAHRFDEQKILYVHSNNVQMCVQELERQWGM